MAKLITYDLCKTGKNYDGLITEIRKLPNTIRITESCWITGSTNTCIEIRDTLLRQIDADDRLIVCALTGAAAWRGKMLSSDDSIKRVLDI